MSGLGSRFKSEGNNYMLAESLEEYALAYEYSAYKDPGEHVIMGFMA